MAGKHDFNIDQGTTFRRTVTLRRNDTPVDLTGYTGRMQLRSFINQLDPELTLTTENGGLSFTNPTEGKIQIYISATQSAGLSGTYTYDLEILANGDVDRPLAGKVIVASEVTR